MNLPRPLTRPVAALLTLLAVWTDASALTPSATPAAIAGGPRTYATPEEAVVALKAAVASGDRGRVEAIFGTGVKDLLSGDPKQDALEFAAFSKLMAQFSHVVIAADDRATVDLGEENWPLPIPLIRAKGVWAFDTEAGKVEIINRRVGEDELNAIAVCHTYVAAQREYASEDRTGDGVLRYARHLKSAPGHRDGLYWAAEPNEDPSPFGPLVAEARLEGYGGKTAAGDPQPYKGYRFKILTRQGPTAPGGAYDYIINDNLIAGFALVAYPAHWGESGVMTFVVNQWGRVYERNLGPDSVDDATAMEEFNPDSDWEAVASP